MIDIQTNIGLVLHEDAFSTKGISKFTYFNEDEYRNQKLDRRPFLNKRRLSSI